MLRRTRKKIKVTVMLYKLYGGAVLKLGGDIASLLSPFIFQMREGTQNVVSPEILPRQDSNHR